MDVSEATKQVDKAREVLESKGAPLEGTAAGHLILALEALLRNLDQPVVGSHLDNSYAKASDVPVVYHKGLRRNADW